MKKVIFIVTMFLTGFFSSYAQYEIKLNEELFISKISNSVYIVSHNFPWNSNSVIVTASATETVLIDTPYDSTATSQILDWIDMNLKPKKITAINTGFHIDNLGGNGCLVSKGIEVYGSDLTSRLVVEQGEKTTKQILTWLEAPKFKKYRAVYEKIKLVQPTKIFNINDGLNLKIGDITFEVYYPGESHSPDNVVVYIKEQNILFGGCMIKSAGSKNLGFTGDANMTEWPKSVKKVKEKYQSAKLVIPHHGKWGDVKLLDHTLSLFK